MRRKEINQFYKKALSNIPGISFMHVASYGKPNYCLTCILIDPAQQKITPEQLRLALDKENIESRPLWKPMHLQPVFQGCRAVGGAVTADMFARGLCLPSGSGMTEEDLERVGENVRRSFE